MEKTQLSSAEIQDLINRYHSELKKLEFQKYEVELTIAELEELLTSVDQGERPESDMPDKKIRAIRSAGRTLTAKKTVSGYKLSVWDEDVVAAISNAGKATITQEIIDFVSAQDTLRGTNSGEDEVRKKVTRSLQKLANRRGDIIKVNFKGKGFAYALPEWFNNKGKLDKNYKY